jgi:hypothetical protein
MSITAVNNHRCIFFLCQEDLAWAFTKNSPYFEVINHQLKLLSESGLMNKIVKKQVKLFWCCQSSGFKNLIKLSHQETTEIN